MIPHDYVELVHKTAMMFAHRSRFQAQGHPVDRHAAERFEREAKELLDSIRDQWAAADAVAAGSEDPGPEPPAARPWPAAHGGPPIRPPGRSAVEHLVAEMVAEVLRLRRLEQLPAVVAAQERIRHWLVLLTGWGFGEVEDRLHGARAATLKGGGT